MRAIALTVTPVRVSVFRNPVSDATSTPPRDSSLARGLAPTAPRLPLDSWASGVDTTKNKNALATNVVDRASWPARGARLGSREIQRPAHSRRHHGRSTSGFLLGSFYHTPLELSIKNLTCNRSLASNTGSASGICEDLATGQRARGHGWRSTPFGLNLPKQRGVVGPALKNLLRPRAPGSPRVAGDQVPDAGLLDGITKSRPAHVLGVAPDRQDVRLVQYKCDAARHAGGEIPANRPQHHYDAARHVLTPVITHALHDGRGAAVAHTKTLSRSPRRKQAPAGRAIECSVSEIHVVLCCTRERLRRPDDDLSPGHALADVIVGLPLQMQGEARQTKGPETLSGRAAQVDGDGALR